MFLARHTDLLHAPHLDPALSLCHRRAWGLTQVVRGFFPREVRESRPLRMMLPCCPTLATMILKGTLYPGLMGVVFPLLLSCVHTNSVSFAQLHPESFLKIVIAFLNLLYNAQIILDAPVTLLGSCPPRHLPARSTTAMGQNSRIER